MKSRMNGMKENQSEVFNKSIKDKYFQSTKKQINLVKSTDDWELWKEQTREIYYNKYPKRKEDVDKFMIFLSSIFDKHRRVYLPRKVIWYLWGKRNWVIKNNTHFWIALLGQKGGEGKSTIADYVSMVLDPTYNKERSEQDYDKWLRLIPGAKKETKYPAMILDEPDVVTHDLSKKGRERKNILERIRILHLFVSTCANSISSIPPSIYERLSAIIFVSNKHRFWLWDSSKDKPKETIVEEIKGDKGWGKYKHAVFRRSEFVKRACFKNLGFAHPKFSPFRLKEYDVKKEGDVIGLIKEYNNKREEKSRLEGKDERITKEILDLKNKNPKLTDGQIGLRLGLSREWVNRLRNRAVKRELPQL